MNAGASLNPSPDNTRTNPYGSNNHGNNYNPGMPSYPSNVYNGHSIDPNQIFGNPNRQPQANQPWNNLPIFPPNPTSGQASNQQPIYPQSPQNYYPYQNPSNLPQGINPLTDVFGAPPGGLQYPYPPPRATTRTPSLFDQFLNGPSGRRRNSGTALHASWQHNSFIIILSICNIFVGYILTARH